MLIAGIGRGTKCLTDFLGCTKTYEAVLLFGVATDTYDRLGKIVARAPFGHVTRERVEEALAKFRGKIMQRPPVYSALRVEGKRLYEYAREGKEVPIEIQERPVEVLDLEAIEWFEGETHSHKFPEQEAGKEEKVAAKILMSTGDGAGDSDLKRKRDGDESNSINIEPTLGPKKAKTSPEALMSGALASLPESRDTETDADPTSGIPGQEADTQAAASSDGEASISPSPNPPAVKLRMTVTSGFYVRSLCHDLGAAVDSLGIMAELVRTRQGEFELYKNVLEYDDLAKKEVVWGPKVEAMLRDWMNKEGWLSSEDKASQNPQADRPEAVEA